MHTGPWITTEQAQLGLDEGTGEGVRIAILDSGIDTSHPGLASLKIEDDLAIQTTDGRLETINGQGQDVFGHGTAVAGIIHRLAPAATVGSIQILGHGKESRAALIQEGIRTAARLGYHILQCSFSAPARQRDAMIYQNLLDALYLRYTHLVAAGSNSAFQKREWPAHFPTVISVGADPDNREGLHLAPEKSLVEFATCGTEREALWPGGTTRQVVGSSFAAPRVTALLARLLSKHPGIHPLTAKALFHQLAEQPLGSQNPQ